MRFKRPYCILAALLAAMLLIGGCAKGEAAITVNTNRTADITIAIDLPRETEAVAGEPLDQLGKRLKGQRFEVRRDDTEELLSFRASRGYSRDDFADRDYADGFAYDGTGFRIAYKRESHWLYDVHRLDGAFQPTELLGSAESPLLARYRELPPLVRRLAENRVELDFKLSLPLAPRSHNASSKEGSTLIWSVSPSKDTPVAVTFIAPNYRTFGAAGLLLLLLTAGMVRLVVVRRRRRRA